MMRTFTLPEALLHKLLVYLSMQPYRDVNPLITELAALPEVGAPAAPGAAGVTALRCQASATASRIKEMKRGGDAGLAALAALGAVPRADRHAR